MNKRDALRLRRGDTIVYGNSKWTEKVTWQRGRVLHVTGNGGIRVRPVGYVDSGDTSVDHKDARSPVWVPYHHVWLVEPARG